MANANRCLDHNPDEFAMCTLKKLIFFDLLIVLVDLVVFENERLCQTNDPKKKGEGVNVDLSGKGIREKEGKNQFSHSLW